MLLPLWDTLYIKNNPFPQPGFRINMRLACVLNLGIKLDRSAGYPGMGFGSANQIYTTAMITAISWTYVGRSRERKVHGSIVDESMVLEVQDDT